VTRRGALRSEFQRSCFMGTEIDALAIGDCFLAKEGQEPGIPRNYASAFQPD
jgi:carbamoyltransferase